MIGMAPDQVGCEVGQTPVITDYGLRLPLDVPWERGRAGSPAGQPRWGARLVRMTRKQKQRLSMCSLFSYGNLRLFSIQRDLLIYLRGGTTQSAQLNPLHRIDPATQLFNSQVKLRHR